MVKVTIARPDRRQLLLFVWIWGALGFALGTATLLGPVRWLTDLARGADWQPGAEDALVRAVILLYVAVSFVVALWLTGVAGRAAGRAGRWGPPVLVSAMALASLGLWMSPTLVNELVATPVSDVSRFTFGPYPDRARLEQLRDEGYTAVISLLHPAVVPFEPTLLAREREGAAEIGIELIHTPMLPWVADNAESLDRIREIVESGRGRYYVHCYLGRDRVGLVRRLVQTLTEGARPQAEVAVAIAELKALGSSFQELRFERGPIYELDEGVYLSPYPTDEEFVKYVIGGSLEHVLSLLDPEHPDDRRWVDAERQMAETYALGFTEVPVRRRPYDSEALQEAVRLARDLPRPLLVHAFRSDVGVATHFRYAWETGLPSVNAEAFEDPLEAGAVRVPAPHLAVGPRPRGPEFGSRLAVAGVRGVLRVGAGDIDAIDDRMVVTRETALEWRQVNTLDEAALRSLERGGPWYVYGEDPAGLVARVERHLGGGDDTALAADFD